MDHPVETITPELALVDPDFAAMARVRLASPGDCLAPRARPAPRVERVPVRAHEAEPPRSARRRRTVERVAIVATWLLAAGILGSSLLAFIPPQRSSRPEIRDDGTAFAAGGTALQPSPAVQPPASIPAQGRGNAVTTADGGIEIRWPADRRATLYNVIVLRDGARIDLWPTTNETASIPPDALWVARRAKGIRYRWFVYPGYRSGKSVHYGPVLAQGSTIARSVPRR